MKKTYAFAALMLCITVGAFAQKQTIPLPVKLRTDSLPHNFPGFEAANPGATVINRTSRGIIYNMPLDNMAVLVPDMQNTEPMPGSSPFYKPAPRSNMPNPLYPRNDRPRKP